MGIIAAALVFLGGIVAATVSKLAADETKAWLPCLLEHLVHRAVAKLPPDRRERFEEEWRADLEEVPGDLGKLFVVWGYQREASKMVLTLTGVSQRNWLDYVIDASVAILGIVLFGPLLLVAAALIKLESPGPIFTRGREEIPGGKSCLVLEFRTRTQDCEFVSTRPMANNESTNRSGRGLTRVGQFLEFTDVFRIPVLFSVLKGDYPLNIRSSPGALRRLIRDTLFRGRGI